MRHRYAYPGMSCSIECLISVYRESHYRRHELFNRVLDIGSLIMRSYLTSQTIMHASFSANIHHRLLSLGNCFRAQVRGPTAFSMSIAALKFMNFA
eukprot:1990547-Lingulodinium_polyedra.AAC.2